MNPTCETTQLMCHPWFSRTGKILGLPTGKRNLGAVAATLRLSQQEETPRLWITGLTIGHDRGRWFRCVVSLPQFLSQSAIQDLWGKAWLSHWSHPDTSPEKLRSTKCQVCFRERPRQKNNMPKQW